MFGNFSDLFKMPDLLNVIKVNDNIEYIGEDTEELKKNSRGKVVGVASDANGKDMFFVQFNADKLVKLYNKDLKKIK